MSRVGDATRAFYQTLTRKEEQDLARGAGSKIDQTGRAVQSTTDLSQLTGAGGSYGGFGQSGPVPKSVQDAMQQQGMELGGPFSPGRPIQQFSPWDMPPRLWEVQSGANVSQRPRSSGGRASFYTLKSVLETWDVARMCIEHMEDDIRSFDFAVLPADGIEEDVTDQCKLGKKFLEKPNGYTPFDSWLNMYLEDLLRFDAGTLFRQRNRSGQVKAIEVISGQMIAPLTDYFGAPPQAPAPAYVQFANGVPWTWITQDDLIYQPYRMLPESLYGYPPIEWLLLTANTDVRFQWHFLQYFTEGSLPDTFMEAPPDASDPEELKRFQLTWDAVMEGDQAMKHKVRWIPAGSKPTKAGDKIFDEKFPLYLMRKTCAAYKIVPADIGITDTVNKASSETQVDVQFRIGTAPRLNFIAGFLTRILQDDLKLPCKFTFDTGREKQDRLAEAQAMDAYIKMGALSPDEVRRDILNKPVNSEAMVPRFIFSGRVGAIPLRSIAEIGGKVNPLTTSFEPGDVDVNSADKVRTPISPVGAIPNADDLATQKQKLATGQPVNAAGKNALPGAPKEAAATGIGAAKRSVEEPEELKRMVSDILAPELARLEASKQMLSQAREQLRDKRLLSSLSRTNSVEIDVNLPKEMVRTEINIPPAPPVAPANVEAHLHMEKGAIEHHSHHEIDARTTIEPGAVQHTSHVDAKTTIAPGAVQVQHTSEVKIPPPAKKTTVRKGKDGELTVEKEN